MFDATTAGWIALVACAVAVVALGVAGLALRGARARQPVRASNAGSSALGRRLATGEPLQPDELTEAMQTLYADSQRALRHVAVVRYDAFNDMGGHLSWSLALLDDVGDGLVLTSIHGRSDSRTYAKNVGGWTSGSSCRPRSSRRSGWPGCTTEGSWPEPCHRLAIDSRP